MSGPAGVQEPRGQPGRRVRWAVVVRYTAVVVVLALAGFAVAQQWDEVANDLSRIGIGAILLSAAAAAVALGSSMMAWRSLLVDLGAPLRTIDAAPVFFVGQLGKYVPGTVWPVVMQMAFAKAHGVGRRTVATAFVALMLVTVVTGVVMAGLALPIGDPDVARRYWWVGIGVPVVLVLLHPPVFSRCANAVARLIRRSVEIQAVSRRGLVVCSAWSVVTWTAYGLHLVPVGERLGASGSGFFLTCVGAYALAWCVGFVIVIVPAGLGVREAALVFALRGALPTAAATALALTSRLVVTVVELVLAGFGARRIVAPPRTQPSTLTSEAPAPSASSPSRSDRPEDRL